MKLKSLLLGSAAALVAFTGARAADAVIAEPEPMEYVRVCDAYGAGYFYIPGTETCLKIGGFVRYQIDVISGDDDATNDSALAIDSNTWGKTTQANLSFSAKSDTEWGTLEGFVELTTNQTNTTGGFTNAYFDAMRIDSAYISLGGLKMGFVDNAFDGGIVGENDGLGGNKSNSISYTFASGGFDGTLSLDEGQFNTNFTPNISANAGFSAGAVAVRAFVAFDDKDGGVGEESSFAAKLRVGADVTEGGRFEIAAAYSSGARNYSYNASEWTIAAGYQQKFSDTITAAIGAQYWSDVNADLVDGVVADPDDFTDANGFSVGANVDWTPVTNFLVRAQVQYFDFDGATAADEDTSGVAARLRFQRSF
jgi:hypothetical protein